KVKGSSSLATFQIRTILSRPADARQAPSGLHAREWINPSSGCASPGSCAWTARATFRLATSQILTIPSSPAEANWLPFGLQATAVARPACAGNTFDSWSRRELQILRLPSRALEASEPPGPHASEPTA